MHLCISGILLIKEATPQEKAHHVIVYETKSDTQTQQTKIQDNYATVNTSRNREPVLCTADGTQKQVYQSIILQIYLIDAFVRSHDTRKNLAWREKS